MKFSKNSRIILSLFIIVITLLITGIINVPTFLGSVLGPACPTIIGDTDGNGIVNGIDNNCIQDYILARPNDACVNIQCADIDLNGVVDGKDSLCYTPYILSEQPTESCSLIGTGLKPKCELLGDIDVDGVLSNKDVDCMNLAILTREIPLECSNLDCADINGDGIISGLDIVEIKNNENYTVIEEPKVTQTSSGGGGGGLGYVPEVIEEVKIEDVETHFDLIEYIKLNLIVLLVSISLLMYVNWESVRKWTKLN